MEEQKFCNGCKVYKNVGEFGKASKSKDGLKSRCKECLRAAGRAYSKNAYRDLIKREKVEQSRKKSIERKVAQNPNYWSDQYNKDKEGGKARVKKHYDNNTEKCLEKNKRWRANNRETALNSAKQWKINNPERTKEIQKISSLAYRARKNQATIQKFTVEELNCRMSIFGNVCAYCGGPFECIDHFKPLAKGGPHCLSNLRPCCQPCNNKKFDKHPLEWLKMIKNE